MHNTFKGEKIRQMTDTPKWITEEKPSEKSKDVLKTTEHGSLPKAIRSILQRIYKLNGVKLFWVVIPGVKAFRVTKKE